MRFSKPDFLRRLRSKGLHRKSRRASRPSSAPPCAQVEVLEDRKLLTIVFNPAFGKETPYNKGPYNVINSPTVHVIFWGPDWVDRGQVKKPNQVDDQPFKDEINAIVKSPFLAGLHEYGADGKIKKIDWTVDNNSVNSFDTLDDDTGPTPTNVSILANELQTVVTAKKAVAPGASGSIEAAPIYVFIVDPNDSDSTGGFNNWNRLSNGDMFNYVSIGTKEIPPGAMAPQNPPTRKFFGDAFSHEMAERITDPDDPADGASANGYNNGVRITPSATTPNNLLGKPSLAYDSPKNRNQISDGEPEPANQDHYTYDLGGDADASVQPFWSAKTGAYIVPDGNAEQFNLQPQWYEQFLSFGGTPYTFASFNDTYNLTINGDQIANNNNDQITISRDAAGGVEVNLNGQIAYFDPEAANSSGTPVYSITVNGLGGNDTLKLDFNNGDPIPAGGITFNGGAGTNTIQTSGDGSYFLSNSALQYGFSSGEKIKLTNVQNANLMGGRQADFFNVSGWTGTGSINGAGGSDGLFATKDADMTLTGTQFTASDGMNLALSYLNNGTARLFGGQGANTLSVGGWTGTVSLDGGAGNDTYHVNWSLNPGTVTIADSGTGDNNTANIDDQSNPDLAGTTYLSTAGKIRRNGQDQSIRGLVNDVATVNYSNVSTVNVNPNNNGDKLQVGGISKGTNVVYKAGTGSDAVTAGGAANTLDPIQGTLTVNGQGNTTLTLGDNYERPNIASGSSPVYTITDTTVTRVNTFNGTQLDPNTFVYNNLASLTIKGGMNGNVYYVQSTAAEIPVSISAGSSDDTINIGDPSDTLDGIKSLVSIDGQGGQNNLNLFDDGTSTSQYYDMLANQFTRTPTTPGQPLGSPTQTINFQKIAFVEARLGSAYGDYDGVTSTAAGTAYSLDIGTGFNEILVGGNDDTLDTIQGTLSFHGHGNDSLFLIDTLNPVGHNYTMSADPANGNLVQRDQMGDISYSGMGEVVLETGDNPYTQTTPSTVNVTGTAVNTFTIAVVTNGDTVTLGAPAGDGSTHTLQSFLGPFRVQSLASETPTVLIDDSGDASTAARTVTFDSYPSYGNYIGGLAPQPIYVQTGIGSSVSVVGDNADESFKMDSLPPGVNFTVNGGGGTNTLDYSGWTGDVTVDLPLGYAQGLSGGISNFRNVVGGNGNNILVGDGSANILTGGAGRNILIGGQGGGDSLLGGSGQNILLAGYTDDDLDLNALDAVMAEWASGNAEPLDLSRVHADSLPDTLVGGGQNWFLYTAGQDQISKSQSGDILTNI